MRLLFVSSFPRGDTTSGQGLILTKMVEALKGPLGHQVDIAYFRVPFGRRSGPGVKEALSEGLACIDGSHLGRREVALGALGIHSRAGWSELSDLLRKCSGVYDALIWLGLPTDPVGRFLPAMTDLPVINYVVDSYGFHSARRIASAADRIRAVLARRMERSVLAGDYRAFIYVSQEDFDYARRLVPTAKTTTLKLLPIGVDLDQWSPAKDQPARSRPVVIFSGVMNFEPNVQAALHLVRDILPLVRSDAEFRIVGKDPTPEVRELANCDPRVVVTGTVKDMVAEYRNSDLAVAPMVGTGGIKIKILQAMAVGLPVVATRTCAAAFPEPPESLLVTASSVEFAGAIDCLIVNREKRIERGKAGRKFVEEGWAWKSRAEQLAAMISDTILDR